MTKEAKRIIIAIAACALVLLVLICVAVGCDNEESPNTTDPTGNISATGDATDPTGEGNVGDSTQPSGGTNDSTDPSGGSTEDDDPIIPSVSLGITDRDDFENDNPPDPTKPATGGDGNTDPTTTPTTAPTSPSTEPTEPTEMPTYPEVEGIKLLTWEEYEALGGPGQRAYKESFPNRDDYYAWLEAAQAEYKANHESEFGGNVDIGDILNGNNP